MSRQFIGRPSCFKFMIDSINKKKRLASSGAQIDLNKYKWFVSTYHYCLARKEEVTTPKAKRNLLPILYTVESRQGLFLWWKN